MQFARQECNSQRRAALVRNFGALWAQVRAGADEPALLTTLAERIGELQRMAAETRGAHNC